MYIQTTSCGSSYLQFDEESDKLNLGKRLKFNQIEIALKKNNIQTYVHDLTVIFCNQKLKKCSDYVLSSYSFTSRQ